MLSYLSYLLCKNERIPRFLCLQLGRNCTYHSYLDMIVVKYLTWYWFECLVIRAYIQWARNCCGFYLFNENQRTSKSQQIQYDSCCLVLRVLLLLILLLLLWIILLCVAHLLILIRSMHDAKGTRKRERNREKNDERKVCKHKKTN